MAIGCELLKRAVHQASDPRAGTEPANVVTIFVHLKNLVVLHTKLPGIFGMSQQVLAVPFHEPVSRDDEQVTVRGLVHGADPLVWDYGDEVPAIEPIEPAASSYPQNAFAHDQAGDAVARPRAGVIHGDE